MRMLFASFLTLRFQIRFLALTDLAFEPFVHTSVCELKMGKIVIGQPLKIDFLDVLYGIANLRRCLNFEVEKRLEKAKLESRIPEIFFFLKNELFHLSLFFHKGQLLFCRFSA